jgi:AAA domain/R3H domain
VLQVRSVDGFQGQEREAVVLSFVRSNASKEVGFLADHRRINVAVTRAKRHVAIVADSDTVSSDPFLKRLIEYMHAHGVIRSAMEFDEVNGRASFISAASSSRIDEISSRFIASSAVAGPRARGGGIEAGKASSDARNDKRRKEFIAFFRSQFASVERTVQSIENNSAKIERIRFPYPALSDKEAGLDKAASVAVVSREGNVLRLTFPPSLSSFERMLVHELAETSGMVHESVGEGDTRRIVVSRSFILPVAVEPPVKPISAVFSSLRPSCLEAVADEGHLLESASEALLCETHSVSPPPVPVERTIQSVLEPEAVLAPAVQTDVNAIHSAPPEPPSMAVLAAERAARQKAKGVVGGPRVTAKPGNAVSLGDRGLSGSGKAKNATSGGAAGGPSLYLGVPSVGVKQVPDVLSAKGKSSSVTPSAEVDDDMALLDAVIAQSRVCAGKGCTKSILTISCLCKFCNLKFCYAHGQAEAHGCGDRAREAARAGVKASASTGDSKPLQGWQRTSLESQLKKKLDESAAKRASAPKKSTSKKK